MLIEMSFCTLFCLTYVVSRQRTVDISKNPCYDSLFATRLLSRATSSHPAVNKITCNGFPTQPDYGQRMNIGVAHLGLPSSERSVSALALSHNPSLGGFCTILWLMSLFIRPTKNFTDCKNCRSRVAHARHSSHHFSPQTSRTGTNLTKPFLHS